MKTKRGLALLLAWLWIFFTSIVFTSPARIPNAQKNSHGQLFDQCFVFGDLCGASSRLLQGRRPRPGNHLHGGKPDQLGSYDRRPGL